MANTDPFKNTPPASAVVAWSTDELRSIVRSTNPNGRFAEHVSVAKSELARRKARA